MSDRQFSYDFLDNVDYDMVIGGKFDEGSTYLTTGFAGYML